MTTDRSSELTDMAHNVPSSVKKNNSVNILKWVIYRSRVFDEDSIFSDNSSLSSISFALNGYKNLHLGCLILMSVTYHLVKTALG